MNLYFQNANTKSEGYTWAEWTFKVGDPVIFLDTKRSPLLYNNLKGRIVDISKRDSAILFTLDIDTILTERQCRNESFEFVDVTDFGTRIRLEVIANDDESTAEEERIKTIIPFQIAYAVSIHKAQGLEYNCVSTRIVGLIGSGRSNSSLGFERNAEFPERFRRRIFRSALYSVPIKPSRRRKHRNAYFSFSVSLSFAVIRFWFFAMSHNAVRIPD